MAGGEATALAHVNLVGVHSDFTGNELTCDWTATAITTVVVKTLI